MAELISKQTKENHARAMIDGTKNVIHIKANDATRLFVFGDIHGAFHSVLRVLLHLREIDVIDDDLIIKDKDAYIIFNGDT